MPREAERSGKSHGSGEGGDPQHFARGPAQQAARKVRFLGFSAGSLMFDLVDRNGGVTCLNLTHASSKMRHAQSRCTRNQGHAVGMYPATRADAHTNRPTDWW